MAAARAAQEALYLLHLLRDLGYEQLEPTVIYEDNDACIAMSKNPVLRDSCSHIDCRDNFLRELVEKRQIRLERKGTADMAADALTKALPKDPHEKHGVTMMGA